MSNLGGSGSGYHPINKQGAPAFPDPANYGSQQQQQQQQQPAQQSAYPGPQSYGGRPASSLINTPSTGSKYYQPPPGPAIPIPSSTGASSAAFPAPAPAPAAGQAQPYYSPPAQPSAGSFAPASKYAPPSQPTPNSYFVPIASTPSQQSYAAAPPGQLFARKATRKEVPLQQNGTFVVEVPLPTSHIENCTYKTEEFTKIRYTAATTDPNAFADKYTLMPRILRRNVKMAIVATMYNEDDELFCKSVFAVFQNIAYLCSNECPGGLGPDGWKDIVLCIVSDGRTKINKRVLTVLGCMGLYLEGLTKSSVNGEEVSAHIFESICQRAVDHSLDFHDDMVPVQTIFLLKEKNAKKINSHRWFFNAVCKVIDPEVCILLDIGTKPTRQSFFHLYRAFADNEHIGGACGEIAAELGPWMKNLLNPLVATQNFEYKMSNILDKPLESVFGYISVLPGAFSAYRFKALEGKPLECYFKGETMHGGADIFSANMYLAEDRILCFELVTKKNERWLLKYVKSAKAETDVPDQLPELISQRRRWLNGSFFAAVHALQHFYHIGNSGHSQGRKMALYVQAFYNAINLLFSWFSLGTFYLSFYFVFDVAKGSSDDTGAEPSNLQGIDLYYPYGNVVFSVVNAVYVGVISMIFISALGNRPQGSKWLYWSCVLIFTVIMIMMLVNGGWSIALAIRDMNSSMVDAIKSGNSFSSFNYFFTNKTFRDMVTSLVATYGLYFASSVIHLDPWHCVTSMVQYLLLLPMYINIFMIYAFTNLHDVSWGTKGDNTVSSAGDAVQATKGADGKQVATVDIPDEKEDVNEQFRHFQQQLERQKNKEEEAPKKQDAKTQQDDFFKLFRTRVVLLWLVCNGILVGLFTNKSFLMAVFPNQTQQLVNPFLTFIFWSVAILSAVRFIFSTLYIVQWASSTATKAGLRNPLKGEF
ncbi:chitin synthase-domain-containing protein [Polychytrium aggregatum]|uniref:chitin synthase-domain-containing protein n=1 Tax=Polychytrium aggregatum TaxID=110093 RepID=UPI0022FE9EC5|nr:chitin synthase-domain-containing protein [Polychytrium aggregatum]KAI9204458.1 chitin synthase-domain-containing protein [Polychytrium aggregatum]